MKIDKLYFLSYSGKQWEITVPEVKEEEAISAFFETILAYTGDGWNFFFKDKKKAVKMDDISAISVDPFKRSLIKRSLSCWKKVKKMISK